MRSRMERYFMPRVPTGTGRRNCASGVYRSTCHGGERTVLEGQLFPRCGYCNQDTSWIFLRRVTQSAATTARRMPN